MFYTLYCSLMDGKFNRISLYQKHQHQDPSLLQIFNKEFDSSSQSLYNCDIAFVYTSWNSSIRVDTVEAGKSIFACILKWKGQIGKKNNCLSQHHPKNDWPQNILQTPKTTASSSLSIPQSLKVTKSFSCVLLTCKVNGFWHWRAERTSNFFPIPNMQL